MQSLAGCRRQPGRRCFFDDLLVAALYRAIALAQRHDLAASITEDLYFDVPGVVDVALEKCAAVWLEIGMLLMQEPKLLLLDEPVAGMTDVETDHTAELLNTLRGRHSLMVVEHDMDFVARIADGGKVTVLHEGAVLAEGTMAQVQSDARVIEVYLGR